MDLSLGGCRLYTTAIDLSEGESIELSFRLPGSTAVLTVEGSVRRVTGFHRALGAGVEFINLPEGVIADLQAFLAPPSPADKDDDPLNADTLTSPHGESVGLPRTDEINP